VQPTILSRHCFLPFSLESIARLSYTTALSMIPSSTTLIEAMTARAHYSDKNREGKKSSPRRRIYFQAISKFKLLNVKRFSSREPITQLKRIHERHPSKPRAQSNQTLLQVFFQAASPVGVTRAKCWKVSELKSIHRTRIRGTARARVRHPRFSFILVKGPVRE